MCEPVPGSDGLTGTSKQTGTCVLQLHPEYPFHEAFPGGHSLLRAAF